MLIHLMKANGNLEKEVLSLVLLYWWSVLAAILQENLRCTSNASKSSGKMFGFAPPTPTLASCTLLLPALRIPATHGCLTESQPQPKRKNIINLVCYSICKYSWDSVVDLCNRGINWHDFVGLLVLLDVVLNGWSIVLFFRWICYSGIHCMTCTCTNIPCWRL